MQACKPNLQCNVAAEVLPASPRSATRSLSPGAMTVFSFASAMLIAASSSAVTPLYHLYQASMHLTPFWITIVFASYVASLLTALLTVGGLSDYVGRRPVILAALLLNAAAMMLFSAALMMRVVRGWGRCFFPAQLIAPLPKPVAPRRHLLARLLHNLLEFLSRFPYL